MELLFEETLDIVVYVSSFLDIVVYVSSCQVMISTE
jgi:hypothetical protein